MKSLRDGCEMHIKENLRVTHAWDDTWNENFSVNTALMSLLTHGDFQEDAGSHNAKACRMQSAQLLLQWFPAV